MGEDEYQVGFCPKLEAIRDNSAERAAPDLIQELHSKRLHPHRHQQEHQLHGLAKGSRDSPRAKEAPPPQAMKDPRDKPVISLFCP